MKTNLGTATLAACGLFVGLTAFALAAQKNTVRVESKGSDRAYKRIDKLTKVRLVKQLSDKPCVEGRTWGWDKNGIWVSKGCRADFAYQTRDSAGWDQNNHRGDLAGELKRVTIESDKGHRVSREVEHVGTVKLVRKLSDAPCREGRTWGYDRKSIWVDKGCRAEFEFRRR